MPLGSPFSVPQNSWVYCDEIGFAFRADADSAHKNAASPARALRKERLPRPTLGYVLELLDNHLAVFPQWVLVAGDDIKD